MKLNDNRQYIKIVFSFLIIMISFFSMPVLNAQQLEEVKVLVCPEGCGPLVVDQYLSKLINNEDIGLKYTPVATKGYLDNLNQMGANSNLWPNTIFANNDDTMIFGPRGGKHPFTKFIPEPVNKTFKLLYGFYWGTTGHFFITFNPNIKQISDLKGKKIGLGIYGQSDWGMNPTLDLEYGYGITAENTDLQYLGPNKLGKAILAGDIDATVAALGTNVNFDRWLPAGIFREIKKSKFVYYLGHESAVIDNINQKLGAAYIPVNIPVGTLPKQREELKTFADRDFKVCHYTFPEETAYIIVKMAAKFGPRMMLNANLWQTWSPEIMVAGLTEENTHPGAIRAFKELGWWELRNKFNPIILPNQD